MGTKELDEGWAAAVCALFNRVTDGLPHCFPAGEKEFRLAMTRLPELARDSFWIGVIDNDRLVGFAAGQVNTGSNQDGAPRVAGEGDGSLCGFFCEDASWAGKLLDGVEDRFLSLGVERVAAFDAGEHHNHWPFFNGGFGACPEGLPVACQILARSGFTIANRELHMTCELDPNLSGVWGTRYLQDFMQFDEEEHPFPLPSGTMARWASQSPQRLELNAFSGVRNIGGCSGHLLSAFQHSPKAAEVGYIGWLGVSPEFQRQGLGRALLCRMLQRMKELRMQRVFLTTGSQNWRAQPLYLSMGFGVVGTSVTLVREGGSRW